MRGRLLGVAIWALGLGGLTGCFSPPPEAVARLEEVKQQGQQLEVAADGLEERFLGNQEKVHLWRELRERHQHVSAVVVQNHTSHVEDMARLAAAQQEKARKLNRSFASAGPFLSSAAPPKRAGLNAR